MNKIRKKKNLLHWEGEKIHGDKREVQIKFMKRGRDGYYFWPKREDVDTVDVNFIFSTIFFLLGQVKRGEVMLTVRKTSLNCLISIRVTTCEYNHCIIVLVILDLIYINNNIEFPC